MQLAGHPPALHPQLLLASGPEACPSRGIQKARGRASTHPACGLWNVNPSICFFAGYRNALVVIQRHTPGLQCALIWGVAKPGGPEFFHTSPLLLEFTFHSIFLPPDNKN